MQLLKDRSIFRRLFFRKLVYVLPQNGTAQLALGNVQHCLLGQCRRQNSGSQFLEHVIIWTIGPLCVHRTTFLITPIHLNCPFNPKDVKVRVKPFVVSKPMKIWPLNHSA
jgi:hypothetical protein